MVAENCRARRSVLFLRKQVPKAMALWGIRNGPGMTYLTINNMKSWFLGLRRKRWLLGSQRLCTRTDWTVSKHAGTCSLLLLDVFTNKSQYLIQAKRYVLHLKIKLFI